MPTPRGEEDTNSRDTSPGNTPQHRALNYVQVSTGGCVSNLYSFFTDLYPGQNLNSEYIYGTLRTPKMEP